MGMTPPPRCDNSRNTSASWKQANHGREPPDGHKKIRVHLVFDVKHDGRYKAGWLQMDILPTFPTTASTLELFPLRNTHGCLSC